MYIFWKLFASLWLIYTTVASSSLYFEYDRYSYPNSGSNDFGRLSLDLVSNEDNQTLAIVICNKNNNDVPNVSCNVTVTAHVIDKPKISKTCHFTLSHLNETVRLYDATLLRNDRVLVNWFEQTSRFRMRVLSRVIFMDNCGSSNDYHHTTLVRKYTETLNGPLIKSARRKDGFVFAYSSKFCPKTLYCIYASSFNIDGKHLSRDVLEPNLIIDGEILFLEANTLKLKSGEDGPLVVFATTRFTKYAYSPSFDTKLINDADDAFLVNSNGNARIYSRNNSIVNCMKLDKDDRVCPGEKSFTANTANERELHKIYDAPEDGLIILYKFEKNNKTFLEMLQRYKNGSSEILALFEIVDKDLVQEGVTVLNDKYCYSSVRFETREDYEKSSRLEFYTMDNVKFDTTCKARFSKSLSSDGKTEFCSREGEGDLYCDTCFTYDGPKINSIRKVCN